MWFLKVKTVIVLVLIGALCYAQIVPALAEAKKMRVAFAGIKFRDLPEEVEKRIFDRLLQELESSSAFELVKPEDVYAKVGRDKMTAFFDSLDAAAFASLADELQVDHIFAGELSNNSREPERVLLVGKLYRYDRDIDARHTFEVLKYYDNFGVEVIKFREEFIKTITSPEESSGNKLLPYLVLAGVAALGLATFALVKVDAGGEGGTTPRPPDTP